MEILFLFSFLINLTNAQGMYSRYPMKFILILHVVCTPDVCNKHGTCIPNISNSFTCQCDPGFIGPTCNQGSLIRKKKQKLTCSFILFLELDECLSYPCANNGTCTDLENGFLCHCLPEWNGTLCTEAKSRFSLAFYEKIKV